MGKIIEKHFVKYILDEMQTCVKLGNYVVLKTEKNEMFTFEYALTNDIKRNILLSLKIEDYFNSSESKNFPDRFIHEFCPIYKLLNYNGEIEAVKIYVKFEIEEDQNNNQTVVIGLHKPDREIHYPFIN